VSRSGIWPRVADARLLHMLEAQMDGALACLRASTEDGLAHLEEAMKQHPKSETAPHIIRALTDLQNIDRAMQRLGNVRMTLDEWARDARRRPSGRPAWADAVAARFVMPEESSALTRMLEES